MPSPGGTPLSGAHRDNAVFLVRPGRTPNQKLNMAMDASGVREQLARETIQTKPMTPEMTRFMKSEIDKSLPAVKAMNITLQ
jgi:hypothetical protein